MSTLPAVDVGNQALDLHDVAGASWSVFVAGSADDQSLSADGYDVALESVQMLRAFAFDVRHYAAVSRHSHSIEVSVAVLETSGFRDVKDHVVYLAPLACLDVRNKLIKFSMASPKLTVKATVRHAIGPPGRRIKSLPAAGEQPGTGPDRTDPVEFLRDPPAGRVGGDLVTEQDGVGHAKSSNFRPRKSSRNQARLTFSSRIRTNPRPIETSRTRNVWPLAVAAFPT